MGKVVNMEKVVDMGGWGWVGAGGPRRWPCRMDVVVKSIEVALKCFDFHDM